jgi:hypothetical protein
MHACAHIFFYLLYAKRSILPGITIIHACSEADIKENIFSTIFPSVSIF